MIRLASRKPKDGGEDKPAEDFDEKKKSIPELHMYYGIATNQRPHRNQKQPQPEAELHNMEKIHKMHRHRYQILPTKDIHESFEQIKEKPSQEELVLPVNSPTMVVRKIKRNVKVDKKITGNIDAGDSSDEGPMGALNLNNPKVPVLQDKVDGTQGLITHGKIPHHASLRDHFTKTGDESGTFVELDQSSPRYTGPLVHLSRKPPKKLVGTGTPLDAYSFVALFFAIGGFVVIILLLFTPTTPHSDNKEENHAHNHHKKKKQSSRQDSLRVQSRRSIKKKQDDYYYESDYEPLEEDEDDPTHEMFDDSLDDLISYQKEQLHLQQQQNRPVIPSRDTTISTLTHRAAAKSGNFMLNTSSSTPSHRWDYRKPLSPPRQPPLLPPPLPPPPAVTFIKATSFGSDSDREQNSSVQKRKNKLPTRQVSPPAKPLVTTAPKHAGLSGFLSPPTTVDVAVNKIQDSCEFQPLEEEILHDLTCESTASLRRRNKDSSEESEEITEPSIDRLIEASRPRFYSSNSPLSDTVVEKSLKPGLTSKTNSHLDSLLVESDAEEDESFCQGRPIIYYHSSSNDEFEAGETNDDELSCVMEKGDVMIMPPQGPPRLSFIHHNVHDSPELTSKTEQLGTILKASTITSQDGHEYFDQADGVTGAQRREHIQHARPSYMSDAAPSASIKFRSISGNKIQQENEYIAGNSQQEKDMKLPCLTTSPKMTRTGGRPDQSSAISVSSSNSSHTNASTPRLHNITDRAILCATSKNSFINLVESKPIVTQEEGLNESKSFTLLPHITCKHSNDRLCPQTGLDTTSDLSADFSIKNTSMFQDFSVNSGNAQKLLFNDNHRTPPLDAFVPFLPCLKSIGICSQNEPRDETRTTVDLALNKSIAPSADSEFSFAMESDVKQKFKADLIPSGEQQLLDRKPHRKMSNDEMGEFVRSQVRVPASPFIERNKIFEGLNQNIEKPFHIADLDTILGNSISASLASMDETGVKHVRANLVKEDSDASASLLGYINFSELLLSEVIGGGGFGQVYKASWRGTPVAVKVINSFGSSGPSKKVLEEFAAEINLLSGMRHPNICLYIGACLDPPNFAIVTELACNGSLWDALRLPINSSTETYAACNGWNHNGWPMVIYNTSISYRHHSPFQIPAPPAGTWPWALIKKVASGAARGMTYLHSGTPPVLHRDLKSANLLLDESYNAKVCDFGLSRLKAQEQSMTGNCGTVQWMAPEVLANERYAEPADVYSFGVILWELLSRECPYEGMDPIPCALAVLNKRERPIIPQWCPAVFESLIRKCWDQEPSSRPTFMQILSFLDAMP